MVYSWLQLLYKKKGADSSPSEMNMFFLPMRDISFIHLWQRNASCVFSDVEEKNAYLALNQRYPKLVLQNNLFFLTVKSGWRSIAWLYLRQKIAACCFTKRCWQNSESIETIKYLVIQLSSKHKYWNRRVEPDWKNEPIYTVNQNYRSRTWGHRIKLL